jgi:hypothetical protein
MVPRVRDTGGESPPFKPGRIVLTVGEAHASGAVALGSFTLILATDTYITVLALVVPFQQGEPS